MQLRVDFDVTTDPSIDQVLTNLRYSQAASQLPPDVVNQGVTVKKSVTQPAGRLRAVLARRARTTRCSSPTTPTSTSTTR